ncbi:hypothetical protein C9374_002663 [Naegleria lovaniensis]|uniref:Uncharacterized protein n=1 Tax=Naegleria lovaniensis TaxID=51637 RepID=A0AA88KQ99_NAELO|nr:uncharacterized protein C9374_002663 [Naegleria lovaniensis]KAG2386217.1 hypothetical protein C9374_002663 [Naegleria lovaniensis]
MQPRSATSLSEQEENNDYPSTSVVTDHCASHVNGADHHHDGNKKLKSRNDENSTVEISLDAPSTSKRSSLKQRHQHKNGNNNGRGGNHHSASSSSLSSADEASSNTPTNETTNSSSSSSISSADKEEEEQLEKDEYSASSSSKSLERQQFVSSNNNNNNNETAISKEQEQPSFHSSRKTKPSLTEIDSMVDANSQINAWCDFCNKEVKSWRHHEKTRLHQSNMWNNNKRLRPTPPNFKFIHVDQFQTQNNSANHTKPNKVSSSSDEDNDLHTTSSNLKHKEGKSARSHEDKTNGSNNKNHHTKPTKQLSEGTKKNNKKTKKGNSSQNAKSNDHSANSKSNNSTNSLPNNDSSSHYTNDDLLQPSQSVSTTSSLVMPERPSLSYTMNVNFSSDQKTRHTFLSATPQQQQEMFEKSETGIALLGHLRKIRNSNYPERSDIDTQGNRSNPYNPNNTRGFSQSIPPESTRPPSHGAQYGNVAKPSTSNSEPVTIQFVNHFNSTKSKKKK